MVTIEDLELYSRRRCTTGSAQQASMYGMRPCMCCIILVFYLNTTAYCLGQYSLHIILLKCSMPKRMIKYQSRILPIFTYNVLKNMMK